MGPSALDRENGAVQSSVGNRHISRGRRRRASAVAVPAEQAQLFRLRTPQPQRKPPVFGRGAVAVFCARCSPRAAHRQTSTMIVAELGTVCGPAATGA